MDELREDIMLFLSGATNKQAFSISASEPNEIAIIVYMLIMHFVNNTNALVLSGMCFLFICLKMSSFSYIHFSDK